MSSSSISINTTSHPLFCSVVSFLVLILLFFPGFLWTYLLSPPLLLAGFLFLSLLRLGATQIQSDHSQLVHYSISTLITSKSEPCSGHLSISSPFEKSFVQWNVRAPLEVIYEDYEEDEQDKEDDDDDDEVVLGMGSSIQRYPSLSLYYPETDSDSSSSVEDEMENVCFMWDEEDEDKDELIEISFHHTKPSKFFHLEEENFIEIDISPTAFPIFN